MFFSNSNGSCAEIRKAQIEIRKAEIRMCQKSSSNERLSVFAEARMAAVYEITTCVRVSKCTKLRMPLGNYKWHACLGSYKTKKTSWRVVSRKAGKGSV